MGGSRRRCPTAVAAMRTRMLLVPLAVASVVALAELGAHRASDAPLEARTQTDVTAPGPATKKARKPLGSEGWRMSRPASGEIEGYTTRASGPPGTQLGLKVSTSQGHYRVHAYRIGAYREVRRVLAHLGLQVSRLIRTAYGPFTLSGLAPGQVDEIDEAVVGEFRATLT